MASILRTGGRKRDRCAEFVHHSDAERRDHGAKNNLPPTAYRDSTQKNVSWIEEQQLFRRSCRKIIRKSGTLFVFYNRRSASIPDSLQDGVEPWIKITGRGYTFFYAVFAFNLATTRLPVVSHQTATHASPILPPMRICNSTGTENSARLRDNSTMRCLLSFMEMTA